MNIVRKYHHRHKQRPQTKELHHSQASDNASLFGRWRRPIPLEKTPPYRMFCTSRVTMEDKAYFASPASSPDGAGSQFLRQTAKSSELLKFEEEKKMKKKKRLFRMDLQLEILNTNCERDHPSSIPPPKQHESPSLFFLSTPTCILDSAEIMPLNQRRSPQSTLSR